MDIDVDISDLYKWERDIGDVEAELVPKVYAVVKKAAFNIKTDWRSSWSKHSYIKPLARSVTFDMKPTLRSVGAEIGPDKDLPQGALGNVIEFGTVNNKAIPAGLMALMKEAPVLMAELAKVLGDSLDG